MKFAIIADIHANLEAFQVVLEDIKQQKCTHYACLGDVVGYNANPKECLDIVRKMNIPVVKGNHDEYCSTDGPLDGFNPAAAEAVNWTRKQLTHGGPPVAARPEIRADGHQLHHRPRHARRPAALGLCLRQARRRRQLHLPEHRRSASSATPMCRWRSFATTWCAGGTYSKFKVEAGQEVLCERRRHRPAARQQSQSRLRGL